MQIQSRAWNRSGTSCDVAAGARRHRRFDSDLPFGRRLNYAVVSSVLAALFFAAASAAQARIINAASPSLTDVRTAIASAADGDTVVVPAGTAAWTTGVSITKGITLLGQTTTDPVHKTANDQTIIQVFTGTNGSQPLIRITTHPGKVTRISGITFVTGQTKAVNSNGMIVLESSFVGSMGPNGQVRVDHCHFDDLFHESVTIGVNGAIGVIDHNLWDYRSGNLPQCVNTSHAAWNDPTNVNVFGDGSWADTAHWGSQWFMFMEDNCLNNTTNNEYGGFDDRIGGRFVFRHNHCYNVSWGSHGDEAGRYRGGRALEVYNNDFHWTIAVNGPGVRSGGFISHDNTHDGVIPNTGTSMTSYRLFYALDIYGGASGDNPWDVNVTEADGSHVDGHPPYLFGSGTAGAGSNKTTIVDTSKSWTTNQWAGYTAKRVSDNGIMMITSNTSHTLTGYYLGGYPNSVTWQAGDQYQIHKCLISMDQPCRGRGDLVTGDFNHPVNSTTRTQSWTHQTLELAYMWNDRYTSTNAPVTLHAGGGAFAALQEGRDFFNNTPMPGYAPYTYPHPLTTGSQPTASASSPQQAQKKKKQWGKAKGGWEKAKKIPANEMAQPEQ
jgi:hypothetical protein